MKPVHMFSSIQSIFSREKNLSRTRTVAGICLALGDIYSHKGEGKELYKDDPSIERFKTIGEIARLIQDGELKIIVCTAGYNWKNPTRRTRGRKVSLSEQLRRYVTKHALPYRSILKVVSRTWGTRGEIKEGIKLILESGISKDEEVTLIIASNMEHIPRISLYVSLYIPKKWKVTYAVTPNGDTFLEKQKYFSEIFLYPLRLLLMKAGY